MKEKNLRITDMAGIFTVLLCVFFLFVRPWYLRWGATGEEISRVLPGDDIIPFAEQETRAITINAPVETVWPWIAQLGQDRGGFYSFDLIENLAGCEMPTDDVLRPDRQAWKVGDKLWMYPPEKAGGIGFATLRTYTAGRALGFGTHMVGTGPRKPENGSWSFIAERIDKISTRLIVRGRATADRSLLAKAFDRAVFEPLHFVMERRMMTGLKQVAEGEDRGRDLNHIHVALWVLTFGLFIASIVRTLRGMDRARSMIGFTGSAIVFQILTLVQPPVLIGTLLVAVLAAVVWWPARRPATGADAPSEAT